MAADDLQELPLCHVAIIMDGNKRWAKAHHLPVIEGHRQGVQALEAVIEASLSFGLPYLTVFGFSSENWQRPKQEVASLMGLLEYYLQEKVNDFCERSIALRIIGERGSFSNSIRAKIEECEEKTKKGNKMILTIALSYGARQDIVRATQTIIKDIREGRLSEQEMSESLIEQYLQTNFLPPLDLLIRTSGELRLSNFMLWESAYSELYFSDKLWPDFNADDMTRALNDFSSRERRYGLR